MLKMRGAKSSDLRGIVALMKSKGIHDPLGRDYNIKNVRYWLKVGASSCVVADLDNKIVGMIWLYSFGFGGSYFNHVGLFDIAVSPQYRKRGVGRGLIAALFRYCKKSGTRTVLAFVDAKNIPSRKFMEGCGFSKEGKLTGLFLHGDKPSDGYVYTKTLGTKERPREAPEGKWF